MTQAALQGEERIKLCMHRRVLPSYTQPLLRRLSAHSRLTFTFIWSPSGQISIEKTPHKATLRGWAASRTLQNGARWLLQQQQQHRQQQVRLTEDAAFAALRGLKKWRQRCVKLENASQRGGKQQRKVREGEREVEIDQQQQQRGSTIERNYKWKSAPLPCHHSTWSRRKRHISAKWG